MNTAPSPVRSTLLSDHLPLCSLLLKPIHQMSKHFYAARSRLLPKHVMKAIQF